MKTVAHQITLSSDESFGGKLPPHYVGMFLAELPLAARGAVAMALSNRSVSKGKRPMWLDRAADIRFVDHGGNGSTTLYFEAPQIGEAASDLYRQGELWPTRPEPEDTAFDLLGRVLREVASHNTDSDSFDSPLLNRLARFRKVFRGPFREAQFETQERAQPPRLNLEVADTAAKLYSDTPQPKRVRLTGLLDMVRASNQTFGLRIDDGQEVRGVLVEGRVAELAQFLNQKILILGKAVYRASGRVLRIDTDEFRLATPQDSFFSQLPAPPHGKLDARELFREQSRKKGVRAIFGKWPGDESDEQIEKALRELR